MSSFAVHRFQCCWRTDAIDTDQGVRPPDRAICPRDLGGFSMTIAKILAPLTGAPADTTVLTTAFCIAKSQDAYVDAVFIFPDPREAVPVTEIPLSAEIYQQIVDAAEDARTSASKSARESFSVTAATWNAKIVSMPERHKGIITTYREILGHFRDVLHGAALLSDIVVFPPVTDDDVEDVHGALIDVLMKSGRPVILCPQRTPQMAGNTVLIGWDGGAAAAQALNAAMPILEKARTVRIACIRPEDNVERSLKDVKEYLALHGVQATETLVMLPRRSIAQELLEMAQTNKFDLLVIGGYGHSRTMENIFGGTTESLLSHADLPIFLAH